MLNGKNFGQAIDTAIRLKLANGSAKSKADIARHFGIKPPSLADWVKKGSVAKDKLPELWRYFADVAGPAHWGLSSGEWPSELSETRSDECTSTTETKAIPTAKVTKRDLQINAINKLLITIADEGLAVVLDKAEEMQRKYPIESRKQA